MNTSQLVGTQSGEVIVPMYSWSSYFEGHLRKLDNIKTYQHFHFSLHSPGTVIVQESSIDTKISIQLLKFIDGEPTFKPSATILPDIVRPSGLSKERQWYLYNQIRVFCSPETKDLVCPNPNTIQHIDNTIPIVEVVEESVPAQPPPKRRRCGVCQQFGHNRATCKEAS